MSAQKQYIPAIGRRKSATAQVRLTPDAKMTYVINGKKLDEYFTVEELRKKVQAPFMETETKDDFTVSLSTMKSFEGDSNRPDT
jgi:ribosomal protein S9